jgi:hypothetical protein
MTTQHKNFKIISGGSGYDALPMCICEKIPKSRKIVHLNGEEELFGLCSSICLMSTVQRTVLFAGILSPDLLLEVFKMTFRWCYH